MSAKSFPSMLPLAAVLASGLLLGACSKPAADRGADSRGQLITMGRKICNRVRSGDVRARIESRLGFRVAGKIVQRTVELGNAFTRGGQLWRGLIGETQLAAQAASAQVQPREPISISAAAEYKRYKGLGTKFHQRGGIRTARSRGSKPRKASLTKSASPRHGARQ